MSITEIITTSSTTTAADLISAFNSKSASVAILGMGYVGLPMALEFCHAGITTVGIDIDKGRCAALNSGKSYVADVSDEQIRTALAGGKFSLSADLSVLSFVDAVLICVPTPLSKSKDPDLTAIISSGEAVSKHLRRGQLIVLESTTYPGTTQEVLLPMLEATGLIESEDFFLAFSPERVDPGNPKFGVANITKLVGAFSPDGTEVAATLYSQIVNKVVKVSSTQVAEAAKLLENTFRSINIGLANEMALICRHLGIDVWEVIDAASTKPFGFMPHYPGPGIGGHCIPLDPHYLSWKVRLQGYEPRLIGVASQINADMPKHVVDLVCEALNDDGKCVRRSRILVLGVAYKPNVGDVRESPALDVIELLQSRGADLTYCDPYVQSVTSGGHTLNAALLSAELVRRSDCVLITTHHSDFDYEMVVREARVVIDTRNATRKYVGAGNIRFL
jgi:UDP-N-acetyl-D-glucosamine dehydrogenase